MSARTAADHDAALYARRSMQVWIVLALSILMFCRAVRALRFRSAGVRQLNNHTGECNDQGVISFDGGGPKAQYNLPRADYRHYKPARR